MFKKRICAAMTALVMSASMTLPIMAHADSMPIVTLGADLTQEQRNTILSFFGVDANTTQIIEINNQQERQYLEGKISDSVIGHKTLSCSYILPTTSGGIIVKTANLTYVTEGMLANALLTCGITDCQVLATAPFKVSGTGALTGVMTAYEQSAEVSLDENKKQLATEELILTGDIVNEIVTEEPIILETTTDESGNVLSPTDESGKEKDAYQQITEAQILAILNDVKTEVINGNLSEDKVKEILNKHLEEYRIQLTEETYNRLVAYLVELSKVNYADSVKEKLAETTSRITNGFNINSINVNIEKLNVDFKTDKDGLSQLFTNIFNFVKFLFGGFKDKAEDFGNNFEDTANTVGDKAINIFNNINTDVFQYDKPDEGSNTVDTIPADDNNTVDTIPADDNNETVSNDEEVGNEVIGGDYSE